MESFVTKFNVALVDEHDLTDEDGEVVFRLTADRLQKIADNNNRLVEETGDEVPIVIGHTTDDDPEQSQPEIVGWARNFKVKTLFNANRKAIFATCRFLKDKVDKVKHFPRRSVELWLQKNLIDPIALLGATTPERHLGLLKFSTNGGHKYSYISPTEEPMENENLVSAVLSALEKTDVWQFMKQKMEEEAGGQGEEEMPLEEGAGEEMPPLEGDEPMPDPEGAGEGDLPLPEEEEEEPVRMNAGVPSGSNSFIPGGAKAKMQADQLRGQLHRYKAGYEDAVQQNKDLRLRLSMVSREKDLIQLENEGYLFDRAEELEYVSTLPKNAYSAHLNLIRKRYRAAPVNRNRHLASQGRTATSGAATQDKVRAAVKMASEKGIPFEEALGQVEGNTQRVF